MAEDENRLSLVAYPFPEIKRVEEVLSTLETDPALLEEAKRRGFYMNSTRAGKMFVRLFYLGGTIVVKPGINATFVRKAMLYLKALMRSYTPVYYEKEAVCTMLLDEIAEDVVPTKNNYGQNKIYQK